MSSLCCCIRALWVYNRCIMEQNKKYIAALGYILFFVPFMTAFKNDPFVRYHAFQGFGGTIAGFALQGFISVVGYWSFTLPSPLLGSLILPMVWALRVALIYLIVAGIRNVFAGKTEPLPWVGKYSIKLFS